MTAMEKRIGFEHVFARLVVRLIRYLVNLLLYLFSLV